MPEPSVTIGIPAFNSRADYFDEALGSFLAQDFTDFELLIANDGSGPEAAALYERAAQKDARIRVIHQPRNQGHAWNFSHLVNQARGRYFLLGADDDIRHPGFLSNAVKLLDRRPQAVGVSSSVLLVTSRNEPIRPVEFSPLMESSSLADRIRSLLSGSVQFDYYALFRTDALKETSIANAAVHDLWGIETLVVFELLLRGSVHRLEGCDLRYRMKDGWDQISLAAFVIAKGYDKTHPLYSQESRRSRMIRRSLLQHPMSLGRKLVAAATLEAVLRSSIFTSERRGFARHAFNTCAARGDYVGAAAAVAKYLYHSPVALLRPGAWKSLRRGSTAPTDAKPIA